MTEVLGITRTTLNPEEADDRVFHCDSCNTDFNVEVFEELDRCPYCGAELTEDGLRSGS